MRIVVHEPTVEAPEVAARTAAVVLAAVVTEVSALADVPADTRAEPPLDRPD